jgi:hypothetical protein
MTLADNPLLQLTGLSLFWAHDLAPLTTWIDQTKG